MAIVAHATTAASVACLKTPQRQHYNVSLAVLVAAGISYALMQSLVLPALPDIQRSLHASQTAISWMLTATS